MLMRESESDRSAAQEQDQPLVLLPQRRKERVLAGLLVLAIAGAGLWHFFSARGPTGFRLLGYSFSYGRVHRMYKGDAVLAKLRLSLSRFYPKIRPSDEYSWPTGTNAWVFITRYTGTQAFSELSHVRAELRDEAGQIAPLRQVAFGNVLRYGSFSREFHSIWLLQSGPTNLAKYHFCLCLGSNSIPVVQKRIGH